LLEDEEFLDPAFSLIDDGVAADAAFSRIVEEHIADYISAPDEYLQARSSDLADLRDRVLRILGGGESRSVSIPRGAVIFADDLPPSRFLEIDWSGGGGLALLRGSPTSHVAMLARARGIPMVVQLGSVSNASVALLDGEGATLELDPSAEQVGLFERRREVHRKNRASARAILRRPAASWRGERIRLLINIQRVEDLLKLCAELAADVNTRTRSIGVALTSCTVPAAGTPTFKLGEDEMEMGVGIHGEPGRRRMKLSRADEIAEQMVNAILSDHQGGASGRALLLVNGFGGTPSLELYLMYNAAQRILQSRGVTIARSLVGSYVTSLEMAGCSISVTMLDDHLIKLWDEPVHTTAELWSAPDRGHAQARTSAFLVRC